MSESPPLRWNVISSTCRFFPAWSGLRLRPGGPGRHRLEIEWEGHPPHLLCEVVVPESAPGGAVSFGGEIQGPEGERFRVWATLCPGDGEDAPRRLCGSLRPWSGGIGASGGTGVWVAEEDRPPGDGGPYREGAG